MNPFRRKTRTATGRAEATTRPRSGRPAGALATAVVALASAIVLATSSADALAAPAAAPTSASSSGASLVPTRAPVSGPMAAAASVPTSAAVTAPFVGDPQGTEFWLMFITHRDGARQALYITGEAATNGVVSMPGSGATTPFSQPFSVVPGVTTFVQLPAEASMSAVDTLADRGVRVVANGPVSVVAVDHAGASSAAWLAMPVDALGTRHVVLAQGGPGLRAGSVFGVVATQSGTVLTVTPSQAAGGHAAGVPFQVVLGPGQAWQLRSAVEGGDLSGSVVESTSPVAVFAGHSCVNFDAAGAGAAVEGDCDLVADAIPPVDAWGRRFIATSLFGADAVANGTTDVTTDVGEPLVDATVYAFRVVAANDDTSLRVDGAEAAVLARGQVWQTTGRAPTSIAADRPVLVAQYARSPANGAIGHVVPPIDQYRTAYSFGTPDMDHVVDIVVPMAGVGAVVLDGTPVPASRFVRVAPTDMAVARMPLVTEGAHAVNGSVPFHATVQWSGRSGAYAYSAGQSWAPLHFDPPRMCDPDNNGVVDSRDISLVLLARGTRARSSDLRDANRDGVIDVVDARRCALQCSKPGCAE